jgi:hypothetical protein
MKKGGLQIIPRIFFMFIITFIITVSIFGIVYASTTKTNFIPGYSAVAEAIARSTIEYPVTAACDVHSYMSPSVTINVIGWTHRACTMKCRTNGIDVVTGQTTSNGYYISGSTITGTLYVTYGSCNSPGYRIAVSQGIHHDFNDSRASGGEWFPDTIAYYYP